MRADMAKVIVERPRILGRACHKPKGYPRRLARCGDDSLPHREGIQARWRGRTKCLNEHLGPLRRYLDSQVGQPWDKVFSEICARIDRRSVVRDPIANWVTLHVIIIDDVLCSGEGNRTYGTPLAELRWKPWYVCPRSGLLRRMKAKSRKSGGRGKKVVPRIVHVSDTLQCRFHDNSWHLVTLAPLPAHPSQRERGGARDVHLNRPIAGITPVEARGYYGAEVYATASRSLSRRELKQYPIPMEWWK